MNDRMAENVARDSTLIVCGEPTTSGPRTYVVFGVMRGGTTMVAGIMRALGIYMGGEINESNQESANFHDKDSEKIIASIEENNSEHDVWGWKHPNAIDSLEPLWPSLRNPHFVCVFRDGTANAQGLSRWHNFEPLRAIHESLKRQQRNLQMITKKNVPSILISYEKAERNKELFLKQFSNALGIEPNHEAFDFEGFMQAGSYKSISDYYR